MITAIYGLDRVTGAEIMIVGCLISLLLSYMAAFAIKVNRGKNFWRTFWCITLSAIACDAAFFFICFPKGEYVNMGIGAALGTLLYPFCLLASAITVTMYHLDKAGKFD